MVIDIFGNYIHIEPSAHRADLIASIPLSLRGAPRKYVSGTNMSFADLRKAEDRAAIILYLRSLSDKKPALP